MVAELASRRNQSWLDLNMVGMSGRTFARESRGPAFIGPDGVEGAEAIKGSCQPKIILGMAPKKSHSTILSARTVKPRARSASASFACNLTLVP